MKKPYVKPWAKWTAHILLCACAYLLAFSIVGVVAGFELDSLTRDHYFETDLFNQQIRSQMRRILYAGYDAVQNAEPSEANESDRQQTVQAVGQILAQEMAANPAPENLGFAILKDGIIVYSNMDGIKIGADAADAAAQLERFGGSASQAEELYSDIGVWEIRGAVDPALPYPDAFFQQMRAFDDWKPYTRAALYVMLPSALACTLLLAVLIKYAGVSDESGRARLLWVDRIYSDVYTAAMGLVVTILLAAAMEITSHYGDVAQVALLAAILGVPLYAMAMAWLLSMVRRIRNRTLLRHSLVAALWRGCARLLKRIFGLLGHVFGNLPLTLLGVAGTVVLILINVFLCVNAVYDGGAAMIYLLFCSAVLLYVFYVCSSFSMIAKAAGKIADGNLDAKAQTRYLRGRLKKHADVINRIGEGLHQAVAEQLKSERFKTELVANVSHDIKTPLTSIINYVDLLQKAPPDSVQAQQYLDVLERNAQRLKVLTEDLVDLSKATTGNVQLQLETLNLNEMVLQAVGEYSEKLADHHLETVLNLPEPPLTVRADGRHLWRVLENLFNNIDKYAMGHTRVYVDVLQDGDWVQLTIKNISATALNIPVDALLERFVRGDSARNTTGSGLGLSIAKSLVELQGGEFLLAVDGDLFKVLIRLPSEQPSIR